jgi:hypothetical protein
VRVEEYIDEYCRLPTITGKDVVDLEEYAKLPRTQAYERIKGFLEIARKVKEVRALFIVAEWGEGKSSVYESLLKKPEVIKSDLAIPIPTKRLITYVKERWETTETTSPGIRFFACLLYTIKDVIDNDLIDTHPFDKIRIKHKDGQAVTPFIKDGLTTIFDAIPRESRVIIFMDEFEDIIDESTEVRHRIIRGLVDVINGFPRILYQEPFVGRLHFLIAVTPPAYEKLKAETYTDWQRLFGQRVFDVELERLDRKSARNYILGVLRYCWHGKLPKIPFSEAGMIDAIFTATLGNPRSIINIIEELLSYAKLQAPTGKVKVISPKDFINALSNIRVSIYGGEVVLFDRSSLSALYGKLQRKCKEAKLEVDKCIDILHLLLSNLSPISIERLKEKAGLREQEIWDYLGVLSKSFSELWGIDRPFIRFKRVVEKVEDVHSRLITRDSPPNLSKVIDTLEFCEFDRDHSSLQETLFVPCQRLRELSFSDPALFRSYTDLLTESFPELGEEDLIILVDRLIFDQVEKSDEEYIMLSPIVINIFYPSPSIFFLDFIEDLGKRFEVGTKLMRSLTEFERQFHEGIIELLKSGSENVSVWENVESYGYGKEVKILNLMYKEVTRRHYLRAYMLSSLKTSEEDMRDKINAATNEMKIAYIPLLMIFSWNPLPMEVKAGLEALLSPGTPSEAKGGFEKVFYCLEFPLTFTQCQQVCGYIVAKDNGYKVREEKWRARASRILNEIKFEELLRRFIEEGLSAGYTIEPLTFTKLKPVDVLGLLRILLITNGSIKERFEQARKMEERFRVYGKDFPVCPLDIESEGSFDRFVDELRDVGLIEVKEGIPRLDLTPVERRILSILREYGGRAKKDAIHKLFIFTVPQDRSPPTLDVYLGMLMERRRVEEDNDYIRIVSLEELDRRFEALKREIDIYKKKCTQSPYGYLASVKRRDANVVMLKDCVEEVASIADDLDRKRLILDDEGRVRKQILLELLVEQTKRVEALVKEFRKNFEQKAERVKGKALAIKESLRKDEEAFNNLRLIDRVLRIKERQLIEDGMKAIKDIEERTYDREEAKKLSLDLEKRVTRFKDLYETSRGCLIFDVKAVEAMVEYERLEEIINNVERALNDVRGLIDVFKDLRETLEEHELLRLKCENKFASLIHGWIKQNVKGTSG